MRPKGLTSYQDRHGKERWRLRRKGRNAVVRGTYGSDEFWASYAEAVLKCEGRTPTQKAVALHGPGTIGDLACRYRQSGKYTALRKTTRRTYDAIIDRMVETFGANRVDELSRKHIVALRDRGRATPAATNNMISILSVMLRLAVDMEWIDTNPAIGVPKLTYRVKGFRDWTDGEQALYLDAYGPGTRERLAFRIVHDLAMRPGDASRFGRPHVSAGIARYRHSKTDADLEVTLTARLLDEIARHPVQMTFIHTAHDRPFTTAGFKKWFNDSARKIGLTGCTGHGLRKSGLRWYAENGATESELMSISGHKNPKEVAYYVKNASRKHLSRSAVRKAEMANPKKLAN